uniref:Uncharacterized protein n=1 Tax=Parascaris univalens TaxID=6257 RepID=A0A915BHH4_PARUN
MLHLPGAAGETGPTGRVGGDIAADRRALASLAARGDGPPGPTRVATSDLKVRVSEGGGGAARPPRRDRERQGSDGEDERPEEDPAREATADVLPLPPPPRHDRPEGGRGGGREDARAARGHEPRAGRGPAGERAEADPPPRHADASRRRGEESAEGRRRATGAGGRPRPPTSRARLHRLRHPPSAASARPVGRRIAAPAAAGVGARSAARAATRRGGARAATTPRPSRGVTAGTRPGRGAPRTRLASVASHPDGRAGGSGPDRAAPGDRRGPADAGRPPTGAAATRTGGPDAGPNNARPRDRAPQRTRPPSPPRPTPEAACGREGSPRGTVAGHGHSARAHRVLPSLDSGRRPHPGTPRRAATDPTRLRADRRRGRVEEGGRAGRRRAPRLP